MAKCHREILKQAALIILEEMANGRDVPLRNLGKFTTRLVTCSEKPFLAEGPKRTFTQRVPWFKAFASLKDAVWLREYPEEGETDDD